MPARLGLKAPAKARLTRAQACRNWSLSRFQGLGPAWAQLGLRLRLMMGKMNGLRKIIDKNLINRYITFTSWCIPSLSWPSSVTKEKSWDERGLSKKTGKKNTPASLWAHFRLLFDDFTGTKSERIFSLSSVIVALGGRLLDSDMDGAMCGDAEMIWKVDSTVVVGRKSEGLRGTFRHFRISFFGGKWIYK